MDSLGLSDVLVFLMCFAVFYIFGLMFRGCLFESNPLFFFNRNPKAGDQYVLRSHLKRLKSPNPFEEQYKTLTCLVLDCQQGWVKYCYWNEISSRYNEDIFNSDKINDFHMSFKLVTPDMHGLIDRKKH